MIVFSFLLRKNFENHGHLLFKFCFRFNIKRTRVSPNSTIKLLLPSIPSKHVHIFSERKHSQESKTWMVFNHKHFPIETESKRTFFFYFSFFSLKIILLMKRKPLKNAMSLRKDYANAIMMLNTWHLIEFYFFIPFSVVISFSSEMKIHVWEWALEIIV